MPDNEKKNNPAPDLEDATTLNETYDRLEAEFNARQADLAAAEEAAKYVRDNTPAPDENVAPEAPAPSSSDCPPHMPQLTALQAEKRCLLLEQVNARLLELLTEKLTETGKNFMSEERAVENARRFAWVYNGANREDREMLEAFIEWGCVPLLVERDEEHKDDFIDLGFRSLNVDDETGLTIQNIFLYRSDKRLDKADDWEDEPPREWLIACWGGRIPEEEMKGETIFTERLEDGTWGYLTLMPPKMGRDFERHCWKNFNTGALLGSNEWATERGIADEGSYVLFRVHKGLPSQPWAPEVIEDKGELKAQLYGAWMPLEDGLNEGAKYQAEERDEEPVVFTKADFDRWWDIREKAGWWDKWIKEAKEELVRRA